MTFMVHDQAWPTGYVWSCPVGQPPAPPNMKGFVEDRIEKRSSEADMHPIASRRHTSGAHHQMRPTNLPLLSLDIVPRPTGSSQ